MNNKRMESSHHMDDIIMVCPRWDNKSKQSSNGTHKCKHCNFEWNYTTSTFKYGGLLFKRHL